MLLRQRLMHRCSGAARQRWRCKYVVQSCRDNCPPRSPSRVQSRWALQAPKTPLGRLASAALELRRSPHHLGFFMFCIELRRAATGLRLVAFGVAAMLSASLLTPISRPIAHEGHDHGSGPAITGPAAPRLAVQSDTYELVGILTGGQFVIYLDRFATNEPVTAATIEVTIGEDTDAVRAEPRQDGTYTLAAPRLLTAGSTELVFSITGDSGDDLLAATLNVPQASNAAAPGRGIWEGMPQLQKVTLLSLATLAFGAAGVVLLRKRRFLFGAAASGATLGLLIMLFDTIRGHADPARDQASAASNSSPSTVDAPRRLPDGSVFAPKPTQRLLELRTTHLERDTARRAVNLIGRVVADSNRTSLVQSINGGRIIAPKAGLPRIGQHVKKGDLLAEIDPAIPLADRTTIAERIGEIEQLIGVAESKLRRVRILAERQVAPQSQVVDAEIELEGLQRRRELLRTTRIEPELLRAATDGVISAARAVPGQVVQAQDILFRIVDPENLWVEALVYGELDPSTLADATAATPAGQSLTLRFQGFSRALQQHAALVQFAIENPPTNLGVGMPVTVIATTGDPITALILPREAIVRSSNGEAIVWRHAEAERFEPLPVRVAPMDASRAVIAAGVAEGDRIVVRAADLVNQVR